MLTDENVHTLKLGLLQLKDNLEPPAVKIVERVENNLDAMVASHKDLLTALEVIVNRANDEMGEWQAVGYAYLPSRMSGLWILREIALTTIEKVSGE